MTNPFEITDKDYVVLVNDEGQHSVWPDFIAVPAGWTATFGPAPRQICLDHIDATWTDMRPRSLAEQLAAAELAALT
ncbi:MbtH family protein [Spirilliplanes yamanashiensis]|uniref:Protein mbtH n=1 Tax=Spirilliplanes yamanashiensis TaxID=42233 RepID=A0A8J3Y522_9ACTN|nr:MbtH family protein [Spirilliplanes yamanashiensis]MDP9819299.1 MbtH protein [Spirilliplanes yamanashiensis]GIJ01878.1 protein mbtH [Spirilliplanes yamanashiensis]